MHTNPKKQRRHKHEHNEKRFSSRASILARLSVRLQVKMSLSGQLAILSPSLFRVIACLSLLSFTVAIGNSD